MGLRPQTPAWGSARRPRQGAAPPGPPHRPKGSSSNAGRAEGHGLEFVLKRRTGWRAWPRPEAPAHARDLQRETGPPAPARLPAAASLPARLGFRQRPHLQRGPANPAQAPGSSAVLHIRRRPLVPAPARSCMSGAGPWFQRSPEGLVLGRRTGWRAGLGRRAAQPPETGAGPPPGAGGGPFSSSRWHRHAAPRGVCGGWLSRSGPRCSPRWPGPTGWRRSAPCRLSR